MNYTQPGISHIINGMEQEYGFPLFHRTSKGVTLTEQGKKIFEQCKYIVEMDNEIKNTVSQYHGVLTGRIKVGGVPSVMKAWIPDAIKIISELHPHLEFTLITYDPSDQAALVQNNMVDVLISDLGLCETYSFIPLCEDPAVLVLPKGHYLSEKEEITIDDILSETIIMQPPFQGEDMEIRRIFGSKINSVSRKYIVKHDPVMINIVERGLGIGITSKLVIRPYYNVVTKELDKSYSRTLGILFPKWTPITPALKCFIDVMCDLYQEEKFERTKKKYLRE